LNAKLANEAGTEPKDQSDKESVRQFLASIKLEKYVDKFIDNGLDDLDTIYELKEEHVESLGLPLGHKLKIMKKIKDVRVSKGLPVPQSRQGTTR